MRDVLSGKVIRRGYTAAYEPEVVIACGEERFAVRYDIREDRCSVWPQVVQHGPLSMAEELVLIRIAEAAEIRS